ncbi:MAG: SCP2 domain-containing protein [Gammaproteobacteria bacterium]
MKTTALKTLEVALNRYLTLDEDTRHKLEALDGKVVSINVKRPSVAIFLYFSSDGIKLYGDYDDHIDTSITAPLFTLIQMKTKKGSSVGLSQFHIQGNMEVAQQMDALFRQHHIDWEEHLSRFVGDALAYKLGKFARGRREAAKSFSESMQKNITEFLQEETRLTPTKDELNDFFDQIDQLRLAVDRLEARIKK